MNEDNYNNTDEQAYTKEAEHQRNTANNAQAIRVAAQVAQKSGNAYAAAAGKIISTADQVSGGKSSEFIGGVMSKTQPKFAQKSINKAAESGALEKASKASAAKNGGQEVAKEASKQAANEAAKETAKKAGANQAQQNAQKVAKEKAKSQENAKKNANQSTSQSGNGSKLTMFLLLGIGILFAPIILIIIVIPLIFSTIFSFSSNGQLAYGTTCPTIIVQNTQCDLNGENCTNEYDGEVSFEDYIAGVVAAEVGYVNNLEYYKVAAISARNYFLNSASSSCTVSGNANFQAYMDVDKHENAELIKKAVKETEGLILVKDEALAPVYYSSACVVNADNNNYYVRYGSLSLGEAQIQKIPKFWDTSAENAYSGYLATWYSSVDKNDSDLQNKSCPNNHDYGMSQLGALYLIVVLDYSYEDVLSFYYGKDTEIIKNEMQLSGVAGFINPTRKIKCSSAFGYRIHPVKGIKKFHNGLDIGIAGGEPIYAAKDGTVSRVVSNRTEINNCDYGYGNYIIINHDDGMSTVYAHIMYGTIPSSIYEGAQVSQGEQIGAVGSTGCSTGNHLHYEVRKDNSPVDPADYLDLTDATGTCKR